MCEKAENSSLEKCILPRKAPVCVTDINPWAVSIATDFGLGLGLGSRWKVQVANPRWESLV
jgi:hypothetical protein